MKTSDPLQQMPSHPYRARWSSCDLSTPHVQSRLADRRLRTTPGWPGAATLPAAVPRCVASPGFPSPTAGPRSARVAAAEGRSRVRRRRVALRARGVGPAQADCRAADPADSPVDRCRCRPWPDAVEGGYCRAASGTCPHRRGRRRGGDRCRGVRHIHPRQPGACTRRPHRGERRPLACGGTTTRLTSLPGQYQLSSTASPDAPSAHRAAACEPPRGALCGTGRRAGQRPAPALDPAAAPEPNHPPMARCR